MNGENKVIATLSLVFLSIVLLGSSATPAAARGRSSRGLRSFGHRRGGGHRSRSHYGRDSRGGSRLGISLGFGDRYYSTSRRHWVSGYYQTRTEQVLVEPGHYQWQTQQVQVEPGRYEVRHIPAVEEIHRDQQGKEYKVVIEPARTDTVWVPPRYETRKVKVWIPGRYETREVQVWVSGYWVSEPTYSRGGSWLKLGGVFRFRF